MSTGGIDAPGTRVHRGLWRHFLRVPESTGGSDAQLGFFKIHKSSNINIFINWVPFYINSNQYLPIPTRLDTFLTEENLWCFKIPDDFVTPFTLIVWPFLVFRQDWRRRCYQNCGLTWIWLILQHKCQETFRQFQRIANRRNCKIWKNKTKIYF